MADIATVYTLGAITFNNGVLGDGTDKYWLTSIQGLDGPTLRVPVDLVPFGDGGIVHQSRKGPRHVVMDGMLLIESSRNQGDCMELRNDLASALESALDGMIAPTSGTLAWTAAGQSAASLAVFYEIGVSFPYSDNYTVQNFSFGLVTEAADPS